MRWYTKFIILLALVRADILFSQGYMQKINPKEYGANFLELSRAVDMYYDTATGPNRSGYKQWKREEWFALHHLENDGQLVNVDEKNMQAMKELERMNTNPSRSSTGAWVNLGHSFIPGSEAKMGRINSIAFDPVNSNIIYIASAGGGLWKSYNNGDNWDNLTINLPSLGFADIVVSPAPNNHILYALIGDIAGSANTYDHTSLGVLKSYNSGATWTYTGLSLLASQNVRGYKLIMDPANENILIAAMSNGVFRTTNGGTSWTNISGFENINDIEFKPGNSNILYYTRRNSNTFYIHTISGGFVDVTTISAQFNIDRMEIGVTPDNPEAVYLLAGPGYNFFGANLFNGLFYSNNGGNTFALQSNACNDNGDLFNSNGTVSWYANTIYVDPFDEDYVIIGGLNLFNSVNKGVNLQQITFNSIHADQHNIKRNPLNGNLWLCNDGGVYKSTDSGNTWENKSNGLIVSEYYRLSGTKTVEDLILGGTQDNGHFRINNSGVFEFVMGGDGMDNYFNRQDQNIAYACSQNGGLGRSINAGGSFSGTTLPNAGDADFYPWITPIIQHPPVFDPGSGQWLNPDVIYVYSVNGIIRSTDGTTWTNIGLAGAGSVGPSPSMGICLDGGVTSLYVSNGNNFWRCDNPLAGSPAWINVPLPIDANTFISAMAVNPANRNEVWVAIAGYIAGVKVFRTQNAGATWSNLSLALPNVPVYSIAFANATNNPNGAIYIGTEIGVFYTNDFLPNWVPFSNGLPTIAVVDLEVNYAMGELKAATFGRGIWQSDLYTSCLSSFSLNYPVDQGQYAFEASNEIIASSTVVGGIGTTMRLKAANRIRFVDGFRIYPDSYLRAKIGDCGSGPVPYMESESPPSGIEYKHIVPVKKEGN